MAETAIATTPLHNKASNGYSNSATPKQITLELHDNGSDPNVKNNKIETPLHDFVDPLARRQTKQEGEEQNRRMALATHIEECILKHVPLMEQVFQLK